MRVVVEGLRLRVLEARRIRVWRGCFRVVSTALPSRPCSYLVVPFLLDAAARCAYYQTSLAF